MMGRETVIFFLVGPLVLLMGAGLSMVSRTAGRFVVLGAVLVALVAQFFLPADSWTAVGLIASDGLVRALSVLILAAAGGLVIFRSEEEDGTGGAGTQGPALVALSAAASLVALSADDVYLLVGSLEMAYLPILWRALRRRGKKGQTAFVSAGLSAAMVLFGAALLAGQAGGSQLSLWPRTLAWSDTAAVGLVALVMGLVWKMMILPVGLGFVDMFEQASWPTTGALQGLYLMASVLSAGRVVLSMSRGGPAAALLLWVGTAGVVLGSLGLRWRRNLRSLSVALGPVAAAWLLVSWVAQVSLLGDGAPGFLLMVGSWLVALVGLSVGAFGLEEPGEATIPGGLFPARWHGLGRREPFLAIGLLAVTANAVGLPFTAGFVARLTVLRGVVEVSDRAALFLVVAWVVGLQPLLQLGSVLYGPDVPPTVESKKTHLGPAGLAVLWACAAVGLAVGLLPGGTWRLILAALGG